MMLYLKSLILLYLANFQDAVKFRCDYYYTEVGWFKYQIIPATFRDARLRCQLEGGILASPTTPMIQSTMLGIFSSNNVNEVLTGINALLSNGNFFTIDGIPLEKIPYKWADSEPDNKNNTEKCIAMNKEGRILDVKCDEPRPYVCFRKNSDVDSNICGTPDPDYYLEGRTNKCYKFHHKIQPYHRAHFSCAAEGGNLVIINSEKEAKIISELLNRNFDKIRKEVAFIGFHSFGEASDWRTLNGQTLEEAGYASWSGGKPAGGFCGSIHRSGKLNDLFCETPFPFICEKKPDYPPTCETNIVNQNELTKPDNNSVSKN